jgi:dynein heavy chain
LDTLRVHDKDALRTLENCVRFGRGVLLEDAGETLDSALDAVLLKQLIKGAGGAPSIKIGDALVPWHDEFRFYATTKLPNPHLAPEVSALTQYDKASVCTRAVVKSSTTRADSNKTGAQNPI